MSDQVPGRRGRLAARGVDAAGPVDPGGAIDDAWLDLAAGGFAPDRRNRLLACLSGARRGIERFFTLLLHWNRAVNLCGARDLRTLTVAHLPDALALALLAPPDASLVDIGSGGGLPALPLLLLRPDLTGTLVEPRSRRVAFLRTAIRELGLGARVSVIPERLTDPPPVGLRGRFDLATSCATFSPELWLTLGIHLVNPGGRVCALVGAEAVPVFSGVAVVETLRYRLHDGRERSLVSARST